MPFYEYQCADCGLTFEKMKSMSKCDEPESCPECKTPDAKKLMSAVNFAFVFPASQMRGMAPPNTGTSIDYNADMVIGRDAEAKRKLIAERQAHKRQVIKDNPGSSGFDLSKTHDGDYRVMKPEERKAAETARGVHRTAMDSIEASKTSRRDVA